jgi:hypothetical protein
MLALIKYLVLCVTIKTVPCKEERLGQYDIHHRPRNPVEAWRTMSER